MKHEFEPVQSLEWERVDNVQKHDNGVIYVTLTANITVDHVGHCPEKEVNYRIQI